MATDEARPRPSGRATARLAAGVGGEVADFRQQLRAALDRAGRLEAEGRADLAVELLEEQRAALADVHRRLERHVAGAAVEREAEAVVAEVPDEAEVGEQHTEPLLTDGPHGAHRERPQVLVGRLVASAAAAVVGLALLLSSEAGTGGLTIAGRSPAVATEAPDDDRDVAPSSPAAAADGTATDVDATAPTSDRDGATAVAGTAAAAAVRTTGGQDAASRAPDAPRGTPPVITPPDVEQLLRGAATGAADAADDDEVADDSGAEQLQREPWVDDDGDTDGASFAR